MNKKTLTIIGWVLTGLIAFLFISSGASKVMGNAQAVEGFAKMGLSDNVRIGIGVVEIISALLFVIPRTGVLGTVLLIGYIGGTIMAHLSGHLDFTFNIVIGLAIGLVGYLRFPELGARLFGKKYTI